MLKTLLLITLQFGCFTLLKAQFNTARISVLSVSNVEIVVNSFDEITNGVTLINATILGVTITDLSDAAAPGPMTGFEITFRTANGIASDMEGFGGNLLDLNTVALTSSNRVGFAASSVFFGPLELSQANQTLMTSTVAPCDWTTHQVNVQYEFGTLNCTGKLYDKVSDYYTVEIEYTLEPTF